MPLIYRLVKGSPLTFIEGDNNLRHLEGLAVSSSINFSNWTGSALSQFAGTSSFATTASYALNAGTTIDTGSFATTGSNTFRGNQTITGSLDVSGSGRFTDGLTISGSLRLSEGNISIIYPSGSLYSNLLDVSGPTLVLSGSSTDRVRIGIESPNAGAITLGIRGETESGDAGFGKQKDSFLYASAVNNGINIIQAAGTATEDYIRFYAGKIATSTPDIHLQGTGSTKGFVGIGTINPSVRLDVSGSGRFTNGIYLPGPENHVTTASVQIQANSIVTRFDSNGGTSGFSGGYDFRAGVNAGTTSTAFRIWRGLTKSKVGIGDFTEANLQGSDAKLLVLNDISESSGRNAGIRLITEENVTSSKYNGIRMDAFPLTDGDGGGGAFIGTQLNPATNGYDSDLVILATSASANSYGEIARFVGKSRSVSIGSSPSKNPVATLDVSGSGRFTGNLTYNGNLVPDTTTGMYTLGLISPFSNEGARLQAYTNGGGAVIQSLIFDYLSTRLNTEGGFFEPVYDLYSFQIDGNRITGSNGGGIYTDLRIAPTINTLPISSSTYYGVRFVPTVTATNNNVRLIGFSNTVGDNVFNTTSGNVYIGTNATSSFKLDVSGSGRFTNGLTVTGSLNINGSVVATGGSNSFGLNESGLRGVALGTRNALGFMDLRGDGIFSGFLNFATGTSPQVSFGIDYINSESALAISSSLDSPFYILSEKKGIKVSGSLDVSGSNRFNGNQVITGSLAQGNNIVTSGLYSHAEGYQVVSVGDYSHAEGGSTTAIGEGSHAEGNITQAIGDYSHAEGDNTRAVGNYSHAEGQETISSGSYSHAEGYDTRAIGDRSHAEGESTQAIGSYSHAEGSETQAIGEASHAEGSNAITLGNYSHAEGLITTAIGQGSHAQGIQTIASASYQHVQGIANIPTPVTGAFIVGNGTVDPIGFLLTRSNLIHAAGNTVEITGSLEISGSLIIPVTGSSLPITGSMYVDPANNKLWIYTGNGGIGGWVTSSLG